MVLLRFLSLKKLFTTRIASSFTALVNAPVNIVPGGTVSSTGAGTGGGDDHDPGTSAVSDSGGTGILSVGGILVE